MPLIGKNIGEFKVQAFQNNEFHEITNENFKGHWSALVFYPADFTFVCPTELKDLADCYDEFKKINCEIYSVSTDTHFVHKAWVDTSETMKAIKYPMLADPTGTLSRMFDVMIEEEGLALRGTFIINPDCIIKACEINDNSIGRDSQELLRKVQAAQFVAEHGDQVCPARWKPGAKTLSPNIDLVGKI
ncbi:MAG: alkyl hydroperoxide reductase subunit C [Oscillospiraceae bacterium]